MKIIGLILGILILLLGCVLLFLRYEFHYKRTENINSTSDPWFNDEEVIAMVKERYGERTAFLNKDDSVYQFRAQVSQPQEGSFDFYVEQGKDALVDNYLNAYFKYISDIYFRKYYMNTEWSRSGDGAATKYIPCFRLSSAYDRDIMNFCEKFCDYLEYCISVEAIAKESQFFRTFSMIVSENNFVFQPTIRMEEYDRTLIYNDLYTRIDEILHMPKVDSVGNKTAGEEVAKEVSQESKDYYMTLEPACSFQTDGGMEYRMVAVDRALGSSFYVLIGVEDHGKTCAFVNPDPYNGSGGESRWITFIDENLGFSCLAHGAGSYGSLYRTEDGGSSWEIVGYPSARAKFVDGTYYNPFIMPEKVYEEKGILYLEVGQGADGDYYDDELGFCQGLYQSLDRGLNWKFV